MLFSPTFVIVGFPQKWCFSHNVPTLRPSKCLESYTTMISGEKEFIPKKNKFGQNLNRDKML